MLNLNLIFTVLDRRRKNITLEKGWLGSGPYSFHEIQSIQYIRITLVVPNCSMLMFLQLLSTVAVPLKRI